MNLLTPPMGWNSWNTFGSNISDALIRETANTMKEKGYLKAIAQELKVPLVACAQLSRANEKRGGSGIRPMLSDLRDSGSIEQDADVVMFLHREAYYKRDEQTPDNIAEVIIAKQRNGPLGTVKLAWLGEFTLFDNLANEEM